MVKIDETLRQVINEEQGISMELVAQTYDIYNALISSIKENTEYLPCDIVGAKYKVGECVCKNVFGSTIRIEYHYYNFISKEALHNSYKHIPHICRTKNKSVIQMTVVAVSGAVLKRNTLDDLSHELEHIYQYSKAKRIFADNDIYEMAINIKSRAPKNTYEYCVADAIYISRGFEQDAYFHSLYISLMNCDLLENFEEILANSDIYNALRALKTHLNDIKTIGFLPTLFQVGKYTYKKLINDCTTAINNIQWKMARVYNKAVNDYRGKYITDEKFSYGKGN